jgi:hypothetical protein
MLSKLGIRTVRGSLHRTVRRFRRLEGNAATENLERRIVECHEIVFVVVAFEVRKFGSVPVVYLAQPRRVDNFHHVVELEPSGVKRVRRQGFVVRIAEARDKNSVTMHDDIRRRDICAAFALRDRNVASIALETGRAFDRNAFAHIRDALDP